MNYNDTAADELLILVDKNDMEIGLLDKTTVHQTGVLHRAFSVFLFNSVGSLMLQRRALSKYHSPGLWSNTCCSHPRKGEKTSEAVSRRLKEEMGLECNMEFGFSFIYKFEFENHLTEHEFDHVYFGKSDDLPEPDPTEIKAWKYMSLHKLQDEIFLNPNNFSVWMKICLPKVIQHVKQKTDTYI